MFKPENQPFVCTIYKATTEKNGNKYLKTGHLKIEMDLPNTVLDDLGPDYRTFLYSEENAKQVRRDSKKAPQPELLPTDGLTAIRHPDLRPLEIGSVFPGYRMAIKSEFGRKAPIEFDEVVLSSFRVKALAGGTIKLIFDAKVKPTPEQSGALHFIVREPCRITLTPPKAAPQQADIEDGNQHDGGDTLDQQEAADAKAESARLIEAGRAGDDDDRDSDREAA